MSTAKGRAAEEAACRYLERHGYSIIEQNRRLGRGELDIVASKADILTFVEVKAHQRRESSLLAMHHDKCQRMVSAAQTWLGLHDEYAHFQCRFDLIIVTPRKPALLPAHVEHMLDVLRL
ncbi:MAG: YraN family protein [Ghiorsea sp.]